MVKYALSSHYLTKLWRQNNPLECDKRLEKLLVVSLVTDLFVLHMLQYQASSYEFQVLFYEPLPSLALKERTVGQTDRGTIEHQQLRRDLAHQEHICHCTFGSLLASPPVS